MDDRYKKYMPIDLFTRLFPALFVMMIMYSCDFKTSVKDKTGEKQDTVKFTGELKRYWDNGNVKSVIIYEEGQRNGMTRNYNKNGNILSEVIYKNNRKNGACKNFYPNGQVHSIVNYYNNTKHGDEKWFYENGKVYRINPYYYGLLSGIQKKYHPNGKLMSEMPYKEDRPGTGLKEYNKKGKLITKIPDIHVTEKDLTKMDNKYIIYLTLSDKSTNVQFYIGELTDNQFMNAELREVQTTNGKGKEEFFVPRGGFLMKKINIVAKKKTRYRNHLVFQRTFNLAVTNK